MNKKNTIFDFLTHIMVVWGISVLSLCLFCFLFGEKAQGVSSIFALGSAGIPVAALLEFLLLAVIITAFRWMFFSDRLIKQLSIPLRSAGMVAGVVLAVGIIAAAFQWFPINQAKPWIMFIISFLVCAGCSFAASVQKEKNQNKKLQEALENMKGGDF